MSARAAERLKQIVDELLTTRIADLGDRARTGRLLQEMRSAIEEVQRFAQTLETLLGRFEPARRRSPRPRGRPRRGPGEFHATEFVLVAVRRAGKEGLRPRDVVEQVVASVPGKHVRPSALVSTILGRLQARGVVLKRAGKWYAK